MSRRPFDGFEVHLVGSYELSYEGSGHYAETIDTIEEYLDDSGDARHAQYYTTYGHRGWVGEHGEHLEDGGAEAIADFEKYEDALDLAYALADGKPVIDMVPEGLEKVNV